MLLVQRVHGVQMNAEDPTLIDRTEWKSTTANQHVAAEGDGIVEAVLRDNACRLLNLEMPKSM